MENSNARFKVLKGGPLEVTGHFRVVNSEGKIIDRDSPVFLCRCGGSSNKPYCDSTHKRNGFAD